MTEAARVQRNQHNEVKSVIKMAGGIVLDRGSPLSQREKEEQKNESRVSGTITRSRNVESTNTGLRNWDGNQRQRKALHLFDHVSKENAKPSKAM